MLTPDLAQRYLESCEIAIQRCQQRLEYDGPGSSGDVNILEAPEMLSHGPLSTLEQHLQRVLGHLNTMHTISSVAWRQRPHHGIWLSRRFAGHERLRSTAGCVTLIRPTNHTLPCRPDKALAPPSGNQPTTFATACAKRCIPSSISACSTTSDGAKRITSGPAFSTIHAFIRRGVQEITRPAFKLRLQFGANQQSHTANVAENVKLLVNFLQMLNKRLAFGLNTFQHFRRVDDIKRSSATAQASGLPPYVEPCEPTWNAEAISWVVSTALTGKPPPSALALVRISGVTP
ncbi:integral membrane protein, YccS/YhfK family [Citrobacter freundii]|nr:integral membrane protein, YccS/YhfK family [Citrobacter freundii]